jgi:trehalose 6-phosphate phosphatase
MPPAMLNKAVSGRTLLVFDLDGTLAPIAVRPRSAKLRPRTRRLLSAVAACYPTAVLTGRDRRDAARILRGIPLRMIVGNHGLDLGGAMAVPIVAAWAAELRRSRATLTGVLVEQKRRSIALHFRGVANPAATRRRLLRLASRLSPVPRVVAGKAIVNFLPDLGLDKGTALRGLMRRFKAPSAIYVGDDDTDEDAFEAGRGRRVLTVRVGTSERTAARFSLPSQSKVDTFLQRLLAMAADTPA